ncbi:hypothetical protein U9M48_001288 [Paspalum notatum var. saurae]|uniref:Uncharacterized protein n=1 Tax=Paspalum notatum var. saurae TaxID=547442 RepID=A0AAQ3PHX6_PASNO
MSMWDRALQNAANVAQVAGINAAGVIATVRGTRAMHCFKKVVGRMGCRSQDVVDSARASSSRRTARSGGAAEASSTRHTAAGSSTGAHRDTSRDEDAGEDEGRRTS